MISLNRGEWSELYGVLFLLVKPNLNIVDSELKTIEEAKNLFVLKKIISKSKVTLSYELINDTVMIFIDGREVNNMTIEEIDINRQILIKEIKMAGAKNGAFTIPSIKDFLDGFSKNNVFKTGSKVKDDVELIVLDAKQQKEAKLSYSIKSSLGSPATILNSSSNTNFKYKVERISINQIKEINSIDTRTKLLDRINKIAELGG